MSHNSDYSAGTPRGIRTHILRVGAGHSAVELLAHVQFRVATPCQHLSCAAVKLINTSLEYALQLRNARHRDDFTKDQ